MLTLVANWKMNKTLNEAEEFIEKLGNILGEKRPMIVIAPPNVYLHSLYPLAERHGFKLAAQNAHYHDAGAYTGEVSVPMVKDVVEYIIVGHSERRVHGGETREDVQQKVEAGVRHGQKVILCATDDGEYQEGKTEEKIMKVITHALENITPDQYHLISVMYEPAWAISSFRGSQPITDEEWNRIFRIAEYLNRELKKLSPSMELFYGGSINPDNTLKIFGSGFFEGGVVGNASLDVEKFAEVCRLVMEVTRS